jgi:hypothetical protein
MTFSHQNNWLAAARNYCSQLDPGHKLKIQLGSYVFLSSSILTVPCIKRGMLLAVLPITTAAAGATITGSSLFNISQKSTAYVAWAVSAEFALGAAYCLHRDYSFGAAFLAPQVLMLPIIGWSKIRQLRRAANNG